jgi:hypothetical protein
MKELSIIEALCIIHSGISNNDERELYDEASDVVMKEGKRLKLIYKRELINLELTKEIEKQKGYSEEEFLEFSEWVSHNDWVYLPSKGYWVNEEQEELEQKITTKQLFEQFKTNNV